MYLVTGAAGFIGFHTTLALLREGVSVLGLDNLNDYYDVELKNARLALLNKEKNFTFIRCDIADAKALEAAVKPYAGKITHVVHLAAQAGVRHSFKDPHAYIHSNVTGQLCMLELARTLPNLKHMVYASSSSVYGANTSLPFKITDPTDHPVSLYAATKKAGEVLAESHARNHKLPLTGLRFFTAYGPWGRPDMAYFSFTQNMLAKKPIRIFNHGKMLRDFTYIDDIVSGVLGALRHPPARLPHPIYNLGSGRGETLDQLVTGLEQALGVKAIQEMTDMQPGDVTQTRADISASTQVFGFKPQMTLPEGLHRFVQWYKDFYHAL